MNHVRMNLITYLTIFMQNCYFKHLYENIIFFVRYLMLVEIIVVVLVSIVKDEVRTMPV
jgi:predicted ABC-type sugar transport system permease subunit